MFVLHPQDIQQEIVGNPQRLIRFLALCAVHEGDALIGACLHPGHHGGYRRMCLPKRYEIARNNQRSERSFVGHRDEVEFAPGVIRAFRATGLALRDHELVLYLLILPFDVRCHLRWERVSAHRILASNHQRSLRNVIKIHEVFDLLRVLSQIAQGHGAFVESAQQLLGSLAASVPATQQDFEEVLHTDSTEHQNKFIYGLGKLCVSVEGYVEGLFQERKFLKESSIAALKILPFLLETEGDGLGRSSLLLHDVVPSLKAAEKEPREECADCKKCSPGKRPVIRVQAKRLGVLDAFNPLQTVKVPMAPEPADTYAYNLDEVKRMLAVLPEPAWTVVLCAALTGLRKGEIRGLVWDAFDGTELSVKYSVWNSIVTEPKTGRSKASIPVVKQLADALEAHRLRMGRLAVGPIFQATNRKPLNLDNLARRVIILALNVCAICGKLEDEHKPEAHVYERNKTLPAWQGWHAFRRGLATNLHQLGVADKTIQAILRHSNVGLTMNVYVKSVSESQINAMDALGEKLGTYNELATPRKGPVN